MEYGIDDADPFGVGALFLAQSMAHKFDCQPQVRLLIKDLLDVDTPCLPNDDVAEVVRSIDTLLDWIEQETGLVDLIHALLRFGRHTPPRTPTSERLYRAVLWTMMRHDPVSGAEEVLEILRQSTPGARFNGSSWPRHEFFSAVLVLVYLGGPEARSELNELLSAARELGYHDLAPVLEWYLDHRHTIPAR